MMTMLLIILAAAATMLLLAALMGYVLGWANEAFHVEVDPRIERVDEALPGANCGGCGYVGCREYAEAVVEKDEAVTLCTVGGESVATDIADILGVEVEQSWPYRPVVHCGASYSERLQRGRYDGEAQCATANLVSGVQGCIYGCMGFGDCERSCSFDAIHIVDGLATVDYEACTGCGNCAKVCPRNIVTMVPFKDQQMIVVKCANKDFGKHVKAVCKVGCLGCKACARVTDLISVENNIPSIDYDKYDPTEMENVEVALTKCPMKRLVKVGEPSTKDVEAVGGEETPTIVQADFKTTADDAEWRG